MLAIIFGHSHVLSSRIVDAASGLFVTTCKVIVGTLCLSSNIRSSVLLAIITVRSSFVIGVTCSASDVGCYARIFGHGPLQRKLFGFVNIVSPPQ